MSILTLISVLALASSITSIHLFLVPSFSRVFHALFTANMHKIKNNYKMITRLTNLSDFPYLRMRLVPFLDYPYFYLDGLKWTAVYI